MILDEDKEFLEHYGVKGMKWGVRRKSGGSKPKKEKGPTSKEIKSARKRHNGRVSKIQGYELESISRDRKVAEAAAKKIRATGKEEGARSDARIAAKLTKGERVTNVLVLGPVGLVVNKKAPESRRRMVENYLDQVENVRVQGG